MTDATTRTAEGAQAPSIFTQPVVPIHKARAELRPPPRRKTVSSHLLTIALVRVLADEKPKLAAALEAELKAIIEVRAENKMENHETDGDTLEWLRDVRVMAGLAGPWGRK